MNDPTMQEVADWERWPIVTIKIPGGGEASLQIAPGIFKDDPQIGPMMKRLFQKAKKASA
jgi:hypothetical protein